MSRAQHRLDRAVAQVSERLGRFEMVELSVLASMRAPRRSALLPKLERFFGASLGHHRPIVITNQRVLLPRAYPEGDDWVDVALDRRQVRVIREQTYGRVVTLEIATALGPQSISTSSTQDAQRLSRALSGP